MLPVDAKLISSFCSSKGSTYRLKKIPGFAFFVFSGDRQN